MMDRYRSRSAVRWSLLCLPSEVLEEILLSPSLGVPDLCRVRRVCWGLRDVVDRLWTKVATSRWRGWGSIAGSTHQEWFGLCRQRYLCECELATVFDRLSRHCYKLKFTDEDELEILSKVLDKKMFSYDILDCALSDVLDVPSGIANLTEQFYALYGKEYIIRQKLIPEWRELLSLPDNQQTLEKGAVLIAQWMRPCQCPGAAEIAKQLDSIADMVAESLLGAGAPEEGERRDVKRVRQSALVRVREEGAHSVNNILAVLNSVLYDHLGYKEAGQTDLENSFIDQVLERKIGIPITLCIVYEGVARRLGVCLHPVNYPNHFVLRIDSEKSWKDSGRCIVDASNRGRRLTVEQLISSSVYGYGHPHKTVPARPVQVYIRLLNNVARVVKGMDVGRVIHTPSGQWQPIPLLSFLYLRTVLIPMEIHAHISEHGRSEDISKCIELRYNPKLVLCAVEPTVTQFFFPKLIHASVVSRLRKIVEEREVMMDKAIDQKRRPITTNVKFSVGMIMKHSLYNYRCVIYGWDKSCKMGEAWIVQMNVDRHPPGRHQPFYNVLAHDGTSRYAAQANLMECLPEEMGPIPHWEIGKYFTQFTGERYIANALLREEYPDDL